MALTLKPVVSGIFLLGREAGAATSGVATEGEGSAIVGVSGLIELRAVREGAGEGLEGVGDLGELVDCAVAAAAAAAAAAAVAVLRGLVVVTFLFSFF